MSEPINNIFWVPVEKIILLPCDEDKTAQGGQNGYYLSEGETEGEARIALRNSICFADNYNDLLAEKRKGLMPFRFREGKIEKVLSCELRFKSKGGNYICGKPIDNGVNGEYGVCCIENFDIPESLDCPYRTSDKGVRPLL